MAAGKHWEWRGFGRVDDALKERLRGLPSLLDVEWQATDFYLWAPDCPVNVKLRGNDLKLKRFLAARDGLEQWVEDETEVFPFPLSPTVVARLCADLGVILPPLPNLQALDQASLLALLLGASPSIRLIPVAKSRRLCWLPQALGGLQPDPPVLVELTEITAPESVTTVALEHPQPEAVHAALDALDLLASPLLPLNYLQALALWANGQRVLDQA